MAKTKAGEGSSLVARRSKSVSRRNSSADDAFNKNNIENGLYVHSSPPKVVSSGEGSSGSANIREYLRGGNIAGLEDVVLEGNGNKLLSQSSTDPRVRAFLKTLPAFMSKIDLVHDAAERGNLRDLKSLLDRRKIAKSKDSQGMGLLHKAVLSGNTELVEYLVKNYPETTAVTDHDGRTPLHYCAASKSPEEIYGTMGELGGSDPQARDLKGKTAANYMAKPGDLKVVQKAKLYSSSRKRSTPTKRSQKVATPPKREGLNINGANIRIWIHDQDLPKLERIVWEGQGLKLMKETSNNPKVRQFLNLVPKMMIKIKEVHQAVVTNDMEMLEAKVDQPELLSAKDQNGLNTLHKSAALGQKEMSEWILQKNQSTVFAADKMGRTPLFYATLPADGGETFNMLVKGGADKKQMDRFNKTAEMYRNRPGDLDASVVYEPPAAPRSGAGALDIPFSRGASLAPSRAQSRAPSRNRASKSLNPSRRNSGSGPTPRRSKSTERGRPSRKGAGADEDDAPSSTPKVMEFEDMSEVTSHDLDKMILDGDRAKLEQVVLSGRGGDLKGRSSWNEDVRKFLKQVPGYMENINGLHTAAGEGNLKVVKQLTAKNPQLAMARAKDGSVALHHMAKSGNVAGVRSLYSLYPPAKDVQDIEGRTPLHWASLSRSPGAKDTYSFLRTQSKHPDVVDASGNTAEDYLNNPPDEESDEEEPVKSRPNPNVPSKKPSDPSKKPTDPSKMPSDPSKKPSDPSMKPSAPISTSNSNNPSKNNSRNPSPTPSNKSKLLATSNSRNPSPTHSSKSKNASQNNSRNPSPTPSDKSKGPSKDNSRNPSPAPSDKSKGPSKDNSRNPSPAPSTKSKGPSKNNSRTPSPVNKKKGASPKAADAAMEAEIAGHIKKSEKDGNLDGLTEVILRGDGRLLLGRSSKDEDTQQFLDRVPGILEGVEEIHAAAEAGETRKVVNLIDRRKKASIRDTNHSNILHKAVLYGHTDLVRTLVQSYPELLNQQDRAGRTPLHYAAVVRDGGHMYKILAKAEADPDLVDRDDYTPENYLEDKNLFTEKDLKEELKEGIPLEDDGGQGKKERPITKESEASYYGSDEDGMQRPDSRTQSLIEKVYKVIKTKKSASLLKKHLSASVFEKIKHRMTSNGGTLLDVIKSGAANPDSSIGVYAPDAESYSVFQELFDPIIKEYHEVDGRNIHHPPMDLGHHESLGDFNDFGNYIVSTRVRCARNLEGYPFNPLLARDQYEELEQDISRALESLDEDLEGTYKPLSSFNENEKKALVDDHLLFKQGDRFLEAANACRFWPHGRGIFLNADRSLVVWVNEEDHMRIISIEKGGDLASVYDRFSRAVTALGDVLPFSSSSKLGFLTFCPTNLGTAIRASVHIRLPYLMKETQMLEETAEKFNLQVRGTRGEHSDAEGGVFDISNRGRLGLTEQAVIVEMYQGILEVITLERRLEQSSKDHKQRKPKR